MIIARMDNPEITIRGPEMAIAHPLFAFIFSNPYKLYLPN